MEGMPFSFRLFEPMRLIFEQLPDFSGDKILKALQRWGHHHGQLMYFCLHQCSDIYLKTCNYDYNMYIIELILEGRGPSSMECGLYFITNVFCTLCIVIKGDSCIFACYIGHGPACVTRFV